MPAKPNACLRVADHTAGSGLFGLPLGGVLGEEGGQRMKGNQMRPIATIFGVGLLIAVNLAKGQAAPTTIVTSFSITEDNTYWGLRSDVEATGTNAYADYRIDPTINQLNQCVQAEPTTGTLFIRFNRKLDGDAGVVHCDPAPGSHLPPSARQYRLQINDPDICGLLAEADAGLAATGALLENTDGCLLVRSDNPRIRLTTAFKPRTKTTPVAFLITMFDYPVSWEIRTVNDATVTTGLGGNPAMRSVQYTGSVQLYRYAPNFRTRVVGPAFSLPFQMVFSEQSL